MTIGPRERCRWAVERSTLVRHDHGGKAPHERLMHPIISKTDLSPNVTRLVVEAPRIAADPRARPVRHRAPRPGRRAHPADDRRRGPGGRHHHPRHPGRRQEHPGPRRARAAAAPSPTSPGRWASRPSSSSPATRSASAAASAPRSSTPSPRASHARGVSGHQHHRRPLQGMGHLRGRAAAPAARSSICTDDGSYGRARLRDRRPQGRCSRPAASTPSTPSGRCP